MVLVHPACRAVVPALSLLVLCAALPSARAQSAVVVTGAREALPPERLAGDVVVIDAERLRASAADTLEELLRREAGLQLSRSGGPGANAGLFIRGAGSGNTLVLIDGVRIGAATVGLPELEALSLASIERIEVLRGPGSSLYGADAVGGVVQIFTRRGSPGLRVAAAAAAGGDGGREASLAVDGGAGIVDASASVAGERSDGVSALRPGDTFGNYNPDRDGYARRTAQAQLGLAPRAGQRLSLSLLQARLHARYDASEFLPPDFAQDASGDFRNHGALRTASLRHDARWSDTWSTRVQLSRQRSALDAGAALTEHFATGRDAGELQVSWRATPAQSLTLALGRMHERARSDSYAGEVGRDDDWLALAWAGAFGPLSVQLEGRHDDSSVHGGVDTGRVGAAWSLGGGWRLRGLAGTTFRAPSFNDLYYPGYGVPAVGAERGRSVEAGLHWRGGSSDAALTVYRNRVHDLIEYEGDRRFCPADPSYDFGCARNIGRAQLQGATLAGGTRIGALQLRGSADFLDAKDRASGQRLTRRAAHQQTLVADYRQPRWTVGAEVVRVGARPEGGRALDGTTTVDLRASRVLADGWQLQLRLLNATDRDVEPALDYRTPGRQAWLGLRYEGKGW